MLSVLTGNLVNLLVIGLVVGLLTTPHYLFAVLPGLIIPSIFLLGRYPQAAYYLILFIIPFNTFSGLEFLSLSQVFGAFALLVILARIILAKNNPYDLRSSLWPWLLAFLMISIASAMLSDYPETSLSNLYYLLLAYTFTTMTLVFVTEQGFLETVPRLIVISVTISSILLICGYFFDIPIFLMAGDVSDIKRGMGTTDDPNEFSAMAIFCLPLLAHWILHGREVRHRVLAVGLITLNITAILLTYSRGGGVIMGIILILLVLQNIHDFRARYIGFLAGVMAMLIVLSVTLVPASYWERLGSLSSHTEDRSLGGRASFLYAGWEAFKQNPAIGFGPGTFRDKYAESLYALEFRTPEGVMRRAAHNAYMEYLVGQGLAGIVVFALVVWFTIRNFTRAGHQFQATGQLRLAALTRAYRLSFVSLLFTFWMLSYNYHKYYWLSLGLSQIALRLARQHSRPEETNEDARSENHPLLTAKPLAI